MLGPVLSQIQQKVGIFKDRCSVAVFQLKLHCNNIIVLGIDRTILIAQYIKSQFVVLKLSIEHLVAQFTNQVPLMKLGLMNVLHKVGHFGQQLLIIARKIHQRVLSLLKRGN